MTSTEDYDPDLIATDRLARDLFAAHLEMVEGFDPDTAQRISTREYPDHYYELAEALRAEFPVFRGEAPDAD